jgi:thiamine-phosphate pyrophosphorylase
MLVTTEISRFHYLTQNLPHISHQELTRMACQGGADWVQLRVKNQGWTEWKAIAMEVKEICREHGAKLIINDNPKMAAEVGADGVHLGMKDMSPEQARKWIGPEVLIGGSANTFEDIELMFAAGVDYIGLGPFRITETKENLSPVLGLEGYERIMQQMKDANIQLPVIAIGGILPGDLHSLLRTGIHGVAVSSAINRSILPSISTENFISSIRSFVSL